MKVNIETSRPKSVEISRIRRYAVSTAILWTFLISGLVVAYGIDNS